MSGKQTDKQTPNRSKRVCLTSYTSFHCTFRKQDHCSQNESGLKEPKSPDEELGFTSGHTHWRVPHKLKTMATMFIAHGRVESATKSHISCGLSNPEILACFLTDKSDSGAIPFCKLSPTVHNRKSFPILSTNYAKEHRLSETGSFRFVAGKI